MMKFLADLYFSIFGFQFISNFVSGVIWLHSYAVLNRLTFSGNYMYCLF